MEFDMQRSAEAPLAAVSYPEQSWEIRKPIILSSIAKGRTLSEILSALQIITFQPTACQLAARLCKWGFSTKHDFRYTHFFVPSQQITDLAMSMAEQTSDENMERLWNDLPKSELMFMEHDLNVLYVFFHLDADRADRREKSSFVAKPTFVNDLAEINIIELPRQPDRKICMTCGGRVDGVIYCSQQCRPSASLEWYSHGIDRAETPTMTAGFRTAPSRFLSPSADSQATFDSSQFVPPPYGLVDANPPTPKFVPIKEEPPEEEQAEETGLSLGFLNGSKLPPLFPLDRPPGPPNELDRPIKLPWILGALPTIAPFGPGRTCSHNQPFIFCETCQAEYFAVERGWKSIETANVPWAHLQPKLSWQ